MLTLARLRLKRLKQHIIAGALLMAATHAMAGATPRDSDGVPKVDVHGTIVVVEKESTRNGFRFPARRARMVAVDDKEMRLQEFLLTFCPGKASNATCDRASRIDRIDSSSGPKEQLPQGL